MDWRVTELTYPQLLLAGLVTVVGLSLLVAGMTSTTPLSAYNADWDGTDDLRTIASNTNGSPTVLTETAGYDDGNPSESVAIVLSPDEPYTVDDRQRVADFLSNGGVVVIAGDVNAPVRDLLRSVGSDVRMAGPPLRDERKYYRGPALPVATNVSESVYTTGVESLTLNHGTALTVGDSADVIVTSSEYGYLDANGNGELDDDERMGQYPVVATESIGDGELVVVSDASVFLNAMVERKGNRRFAQNVFDSRENVLLDYSHTGDVPLVPLTILTIRDSLVVQGLLTALAILGIGVASRSRIPRFSSRDVDEGTVGSRSDLASAITRTHPEWDEEYVQRIADTIRVGDDQNRPESD